jgi:acyl-CoA reductase-like NAD-dependent aldehyde dehydrogenase
MSVTAFDVISPVDETIVKTVRFADRAELDARVDRAQRAFAGCAFTETKNVFISTEE